MEVSHDPCQKRIKTPLRPQDFLADVIAANRLRVLPITPEIAFRSCYQREFSHGDPADRIIAATALCHKAPLLTRDERLRRIKELKTVW